MEVGPRRVQKCFLLSADGDLLNTLILSKLGQIYRTELLAVTSINELKENIFGRENIHHLTAFARIHQNNLETLADVFEVMRFSPADDVSIPSTVQKLVEKKDFPDRFLFSWLCEFEARLGDQYSKVTKLHEANPKSLPISVWRKLEKVRHAHEELALDVSRAADRTTGILDPSVWNI